MHGSKHELPVPVILCQPILSQDHQEASNITPTSVLRRAGASIQNLNRVSYQDSTTSAKEVDVSMTNAEAAPVEERTSENSGS